MKKVVSLFLAMTMLLCLTACGTNGANSAASGSGDDTKPVVCKIATVLSEESPCH